MRDSTIPQKINLLTDSFIIGDVIAKRPASWWQQVSTSSQQEIAKGSRGGAEHLSLPQGHPVPQPLQTAQKALAPEEGHWVSSELGSSPILCLCPSPPLSGLQPYVVTAVRVGSDSRGDG